MEQSTISTGPFSMSQTVNVYQRVATKATISLDSWAEFHTAIGPWKPWPSLMPRTPWTNGWFSMANCWSTRGVLQHVPSVVGFCMSYNSYIHHVKSPWIAIKSLWFPINPPWNPYKSPWTPPYITIKSPWNHNEIPMNAPFMFHFCSCLIVTCRFTRPPRLGPEVASHDSHSVFAPTDTWWLDASPNCLVQ